MLTSITQSFSLYNISPWKIYGQHFLLDESLCDKIARQAMINSRSHVLEIGPGIAGLTRSILKFMPKKLTVVEIDSRCLALLEEMRHIYSQLYVVYNNALHINLMDISNNTTLEIVSNLPYNIGTKLLLNWIYQIKNVKSMVLMLQREVVDRIVASVSTKSYGRLSVICQLVCDISKCFNVSSKAFYPKPQVDSTIVKLIPKSSVPSVKLLSKVGRVTSHAFSKRRKMIKSSLKPLFSNIDVTLQSLGINQSLRADAVTPQDYLAIARSLNQFVKS
jgi:16S rRNA (adenine1518-N6/adenine1519-N6)-dimethyltransferase